MTYADAFDRLLTRIPEIVDFTPHFPNTAVVVPRNDLRGPFSTALRQGYLDAGQKFQYANLSRIGGWDFLTGIFAVSSHALRGRTLDTLYVPDRSDLHPTQYSAYDYMMESMTPIMVTLPYARIYVY